MSKSIAFMVKKKKGECFKFQKILLDLGGELIPEEFSFLEINALKLAYPADPQSYWPRPRHLWGQSSAFHLEAHGLPNSG